MPVAKAGYAKAARITTGVVKVNLRGITMKRQCCFNFLAAMAAVFVGLAYASPVTANDATTVISALGRYIFKTPACS